MNHILVKTAGNKRLKGTEQVTPFPGCIHDTNTMLLAELEHFYFKLM